MRTESCPKPKKKRKSVNTEPGKSVSHEDIVGKICSYEGNQPPVDEIENMVRHGEDDTENQKMSFNQLIINH